MTMGSKLNVDACFLHVKMKCMVRACSWRQAGAVQQSVDVQLFCHLDAEFQCGLVGG